MTKNKSQFEKNNLLIKAKEYCQSKLYDKAKEILFSIIDSEPKNHEALYLLSYICCEERRYTASINYISTALTIEPTNSIYYYHLANVCILIKDYIKAEKFYQKAIYYNSSFFEALYNLGNLYQSINNYQNAIICFYEALKHNKHLEDIHYNIANCYKAINDNQQAIYHYEQTLKVNPNNQKAIHLLHSMRNVHTKQAPQEYVQSLFDGYADKFDKHLVDNLDYQVPKILANILQKILSHNKYNLLDMGCGTGLFGKEMDKCTSNMVGIDLSANMLDKAKQLCIYDELIQTDILSYLTSTQKQFDIISATDVFVYIGELESIFDSVYDILSQDGIFCFSIEKCETNQDYILNDSGRYAHNKEYIKDLAQRAKYNILIQEEVSIRKNENTQIKGYIYVLCKTNLA